MATGTARDHAIANSFTAVWTRKLRHTSLFRSRPDIMQLSEDFRQPEMPGTARPTERVSAWQSFPNGDIRCRTGWLSAGAEILQRFCQEPDGGLV